MKMRIDYVVDPFHYVRGLFLKESMKTDMTPLLYYISFWKKGSGRYYKDDKPKRKCNNRSRV